MPAYVGSARWLAAAVAPLFLALIYYKYLGFLLGQVLGLDARRDTTFDLFTDILLPAGISFFTFQLAAYAIDRYRGEVAEALSLPRLVFFISFFPQLVAGPILRLRDVAEPLIKIGSFRLTADAAARAIGYVTLGLAAKVLIADTLGRHIGTITAAIDSVSRVQALYVVFGYSFQLYFDFYGYSLIAIGLGALFGFRFPDNFLHPYESANIRDFWRRWHVTLSFWIRDYLYYPLGGNKSYVGNILIVFAVCGLWHGANWNFVVWGVAHGLLVVAYHAGRKQWDALPARLQIALTFTLVSVLWLLFLFDLGTLARFAASAWLGPWGWGDVRVEAWAMLLVAAWACFGVRIESIAENDRVSVVGSLIRNAGFAVLAVLTLAFLDRSQTFIYFRF